MRLRHTIYNSIGLGLAGISAVSLPGKIMILARTNSLSYRHSGEYYYYFAMAFVIAFLVGWGSSMNLVKGRLLRGPTIGVIIAYFLSVIFLPLGIWGICELQMNEQRRRPARETDDRDRARASSFPKQFFRRAATMSWLCPAAGFVLAVLCGSTHVRSLIGIAVLICAIVVVLGLILGIVALCGMREHGQRGILIPSIFGISISGLVILFFCAALIVGYVEGGAERHQRRERMAESMNAGQTNATPQSHTN